MNCERFDEIVDLLAAGELDGPAAAQAESHAGQCPECARRLDAARERLATLAASLGAVSASEGFVDHVMASVRAEVARAEKPAQASPRGVWRDRIVRVAAYAAAASLFILAGYGILQRPSAARFLSGKATSEDAKEIPAGASLPAGKRITIPVSSGQLGRIDLEEGRLQTVLSPGSSLRLADPRTGVLATLDRGDLFWRAVGAQATAAFATPLGRVRTGPGDFSLHVALTQGESDPAHFAGQVTLVSRSGSAWVQLPQPGQRLLTVGPGQVLTLRSGPRRVPAEPLPFDAVERALTEQVRGHQARRANLALLWRQAADAAGRAPAEQQLELVRKAFGYQEAMRHAEKMTCDLARHLDDLHRAHDQGQHVFRFVLQQSPNQP